MSAVRFVRYWVQVPANVDDDGPGDPVEEGFILNRDPNRESENKQVEGETVYVYLSTESSKRSVCATPVAAPLGEDPTRHCTISAEAFPKGLRTATATSRWER